MHLRWRLLALGIIAFLALALAWRLGYFELGRREHLAAASQFASDNASAPMLFVLAYALSVTLALPATVMTIIGGAVFGMWPGCILSWSGALIGSMVAHLVARSIGEDRVRRLLGRHRLLRRMQTRADFWMLIRLRVLPVAPFGVLDYVAGLAGVPLRVLILATAVGILPGLAAYTLVGAELARGLASIGPASRTSLWIAAAVSAGMVLLSFMPSIVRRRRRRLPHGHRRR